VFVDFKGLLVLGPFIAKKWIVVKGFQQLTWKIVSEVKTDFLEH